MESFVSFMKEQKRIDTAPKVRAYAWFFLKCARRGLFLKSRNSDEWIAGMRYGFDDAVRTIFGDEGLDRLRSEKVSLGAEALKEYRRN